MSVRAGGFCFFLGVVTVVLAGLSASAFAATKQPGFPVPHITAPTVPTAVAPGGPGFTLKVYGANFINGSVVNWNKQPRTTTFVSGHELDAQILASDIATNTAGLITVTTTSPGGPIISSTFAQVEVHAPTTTVTFGSPQVTTIGPPLSLVDVNGDGYLDVVGVSSEIQSYLNNGAGVFAPGPFAARNFNANGTDELADFNGDGIPDVAFVIGPFDTPRLQVNLGNGDGTFRPGFQFAHLAATPTNMVVGDFNQDGVLDLVVMNGMRVNLYFGNGDGSFSQGQFVKTGGHGIDGMVAGDFNGDGKLDLAAIVVGSTSIQVRVLLGNGDGTFQPARTVATLTGSSGHPPLAVSDLNADGKPDLLYTDGVNGNQTGSLIGRGDGTFRNLGLLTDVTDGFVVGDFNSDGKVDLLLSTASGTLRLGNGDGTFGVGQNVNITLGNGLGLAADFNSDGLMDTSYGNIYLQQ